MHASLVGARSNDLRADRDLQRRCRAPVLPVRFEPSPLRAVAGLEDLLEPEIEEGVEVGAGDEVDDAAVAAVAAVGPAARHELLAAEAQRALAAVPGRDVDLDFVDKHVSSSRQFAVEQASQRRRRRTADCRLQTATTRAEGSR